MRVEPLSAVPAERPARRGPSGPVAPPLPDHATRSGRVHDLHHTTEPILRTSDPRAGRILALRIALQDGSYRIDARRIAEGLLDRL